MATTKQEALDSHGTPGNAPHLLTPTAPWRMNLPTRLPMLTWRRTEEQAVSQNDLTTQPEAEPQHAVRFRSAVEEIVPTTVLISSTPDHHHVATGNPEEIITPEQIKALSQSLRVSPLQERRMNIFSYEPLSLPASRVCVCLSSRSLTLSAASSTMAMLSLDTPLVPLAEPVLPFIKTPNPCLLTSLNRRLYPTKKTIERQADKALGARRGITRHT
jgi:hypothetical protein